jgi:hypothetical protein
MGFTSKKQEGVNSTRTEVFEQKSSDPDAHHALSSSPWQCIISDRRVLILRRPSRG